MKLAIILAAFSFATSEVASTQNVYRDAEYISGKTGLDKKIKGTLVIDDSMIALQDKSNNMVVLSIPISTVKQISASIGVNGGSIGRKLLLGVFASHDEEFVTIFTESATDAEAIIFKVPHNTSAGIVAKIHSRLKRYMTTIRNSQRSPPASQGYPKGKTKLPTRGATGEVGAVR